MKQLIGLLGIGISLSACTYHNKSQIDPTIRETEALVRIAQERKLDSLSVQPASQGLAKARQLQNDWEYEQSLIQAEASLLEARLLFARAEQDSAKAHMQSVEEGLKQENQEKSALQNILQERRTHREAK